MPDVSPEELLAIIARDGPSGKTRDRKLLGAIATTPDYMVAGMFIPTDPEQAEEALIKGGEVVLWRTHPFPNPEDEIRMRDNLHRASIAANKSINQIMMRTIKEQMLADMQPHELLAMIRSIPEEQRAAFIASLPPNKRPKMED
jgi:hypothetical protein